MNIDKVIAIQNYGTSGTTLLHSLLDDHSDIISMPMLYALVLYRVWEALDSEVIYEKRIIEEIKNNLPFLFDVDASGGDASLKQVGELMDEKIEVDEKEFFLHLFESLGDLKSITRKKFLVAVFLSYNLCYQKSFNESAMICFPIHSQERKYAQYLIDDFKEVYFVHMVREPLQSMGSLIKHIDVNKIKVSLFKSMLACAIMQIANEKMILWHKDFLNMHGKKPFFDDVKDGNRLVISRYIRLEDLHKNPKFILEKICQLFKVEWNDCLLKTTFMGKLWHNRAESTSRKSGFDKKIIFQSHDKYLNIFDKFRLRLLMKTEMEYFGYYKLKPVDHLFFALLPILSLMPFKVDFNLNKFAIRINAMLKKYSNDTKISICEWNLFDDTSNTIAGAYVSEDVVKIRRTRRILSLLTSLPFFAIRIFCNYASLRFEMLKIWFKRCFNNDGNSYVKGLYDSKDLPRSE